MASQRGAEAGQQLLALRLAQPSEADDDPRARIVLRGGADRPAERGSGRPRDQRRGHDHQDLRGAAKAQRVPRGGLLHRGKSLPYGDAAPPLARQLQSSQLAM
jgi:hypothetical protein